MGFLLRLTCVFVLMQQSWSQTGVCLRSTSSYQTYQVYSSVSSAYTEGCGVFWLWRCDRTRYRSVSSVRTRVVYHYQTTCCDGYTGDGYQCDPLCTDCHEPGICVAPNTCECPVGWTGSQCLDDIDECATGICNNCTNTPGSFQCMCPDGSILPAGQLSCISPPQMLSVHATTSTSLLVSWEAPHLVADTDGDLEYFSVSCNNEVIVPFIDGAQFSANVSDLQPYTTYTCCVVADTTVGVSASSCMISTTLQDIPAGPPENITVSAVSPFAVEVEWSTPTTPNGVIVHYTLYSNGTLIAEVQGTLMSYLYHGLVPYQQVSISVSASTEIGEGPRSTEVTNRTQESAPSMVVGVQVVVVSDGFHVSWDPPLSPNGVITGYKVKVINLLTNMRVEEFDTQSDERDINTSSDIEPYVPYVISVSASTRAGVGETKDIIAFTKEGVPSTAPSILSAERTNTTTAEIQWELLSFKELRGNLSSYEIVYHELEGDCPPSNVNTTHQSLVSVVKREPVFSISNLDPRREYCVGIAAKTGAGIGEFSFEAVSWYSSSIFTVVLAVTSCPQWIEEMPLEKTEDIVEEISSGIEHYCQCHFPKDYIVDTIFLCDKERPENVIFQGRIIGTNERDSEDLVEQLDKWKSNKPTMVIQGTQVQVVTTKDPRDEHQEDNSAPGIAAGLGGAAIALLILTVIATAGFIYWKRRQTRPKNDNLKSTPMNTATAKIPTKADLDDDTLKDLPNPFYGYGTHEQDDTINSGTYSEVRTELQPDLVKAVANPAYGITKGDIVLNPLYTNINQQETVGTSLSSRELYTEAPANKEVHVYEAPDN